MSEDLRGPVPLANLPTVPVEAEAASRSLIGSADDLLLLHNLRAGDEAVFAFLFDQYCPAMSRLALLVCLQSHHR